MCLILKIHHQYLEEKVAYLMVVYQVTDQDLIIQIREISYQKLHEKYHFAYLAVKTLSPFTLVHLANLVSKELTFAVFVVNFLKSEKIINSKLLIINNVIKL